MYILIVFFVPKSTLILALRGKEDEPKLFCGLSEATQGNKCDSFHENLGAPNLSPMHGPPAHFLYVSSLGSFTSAGVLKGAWGTRKPGLFLCHNIEVMD